MFGLMQESGTPFTGPRSSKLPITIPSLGVAMTHDWDAKTIEGTAGDAVPSWLSHSSTARMSTSGAQPKLMREANGAPFLRFTASAAESLTYQAARPQPHTVVMMLRVRTIPASGATAGISGAAGSLTRSVVRLNANSAIQAGDGGEFLTSEPVSVNGWVSVIAEFNGTGSVLTVNGLTATGAIGAGVAGAGQALTIGRGDGTSYSDIDVKRVGYLSRALTAVERKTISNAL